MLLPSSPRLLLALGAVALALVGSTGVRAEALSSPSIDLAKDTGSSLMKRTFHGGYNYCVPGNGLKMAFYNGGCVSPGCSYWLAGCDWLTYLTIIWKTIA